MRRVGNILLALILTVTLVIPVSLSESNTAYAADDSIERKKDKKFDNNHTSKEWESRGSKTVKVDAWYDITNVGDKGTIKAKLQKKKGDKWSTVDTKKITAKGKDHRHTITFDQVDSVGRYRIFFDGPNQNFPDVNNRLTYEIFQAGPEQNEQPSGEKVASAKNKEFDNNHSSKEWRSNGSKVNIELWYDITGGTDSKDMTLEFQKWKNGKFETVEKKKVKAEGLRNRIEHTFQDDIEKGKVYRIFFNGYNTWGTVNNRVTYNVYQAKIKTIKQTGKAKFTTFDSKDGKLTVQAKAEFDDTNLDNINGWWQYKILKSKNKDLVYKSKWIKADGASHEAIKLTTKNFKKEKKAIIEATYIAEVRDLKNGKITKYKAIVTKNSKRPAPKEDPPKEDPPKEDPPKEDPPKEDPPKEDPPKEDPPKEDPPKEDPPKEDPPKEDPPKEDPPKEDPPKEDPPKEDPPKEDPPKEDPPKEDPPKEDPPKEDPPKEDPPKEDPPKEDPPTNQVTIEAKNEITSAGDLSLKAWLKDQQDIKGEWTFTYADLDAVTKSGTEEITYTIPKDKLQNGKHDLKIAFTSEDKKTIGELSLVVEVEGKTEEPVPEQPNEPEQPEKEQPGLEQVNDDPDSNTVTPPTTTPDATNKVTLGGPLPKTATQQPVGLLVGTILLIAGCGYFALRYYRKKSV